uniref:Copine C-terminal domain-containing protein n=1 Tax=Salix viminalis TaxID=40686 RepID=A0A6N2MJJ1_SALVM
MVAIDFTASNGNPRLPDSLHYVDPSGRLNAYQRQSRVGEVLQFYDSDKRFPAWDLAHDQLMDQLMVSKEL